MSKTVIILGAGASQEAGAPLMKDFLDAAERRKDELGASDSLGHFKLVFKGLHELDAVHAKAQIDVANIESVFAMFEMAALTGHLGSLTDTETKRLPDAMKTVIDWTLRRCIRHPVLDKGGKRTVDPPTPYGAFAKSVARILNSDTNTDYSKISVISFNYDLCVDYAMYKQGIPVDYRLEKDDKSVGLRLLKLHGSLNWATCTECEKVIPWHLPDFFGTNEWHPAHHNEFVFLDISAKLDSLTHCDVEAHGPSIVPPTWNKLRYQQQLQPVWEAAASEFSEAENIVVIGYSLPTSDHFFRDLYALGAQSPARIKSFWVFNPDKSVADRFRELLGPTVFERFRFYDLPFGGALSQQPLVEFFRPS